MKTVDTKWGPWTREMYERLVAAYETALRRGEDQFLLAPGHPVLTQFAKYLIEFLELPENFGPKGDQ